MEVLEWYRKNLTSHNYHLDDLYFTWGISKQGHWANMNRRIEELNKEPLYIGLIEDIREMHPGMGLRKMYNQFKPEGIGRDSFISLGLRNGFRLKTIKLYHKTTYSVKSSRYENLLISKKFTGVNQVWVSDLFYFPIGREHFYVVLLMDIYSRRIVGYSVSDNMRAVNNIKALNMALIMRGIKDFKNELIHHSDRGSQYVSNDYTNLLDNANIRISMCTMVLENAHCERANGTIKNEYLSRWNIKNYHQLKYKTRQAVKNYNNRLHNSIGMTPIEYEIYLQSVTIEKRKKMEIFTINRALENPQQLSLDFNL